MRRRRAEARDRPNIVWSGPVSLEEAIAVAVSLSEIDLLSKEISELEREITTFRDETSRMERDILEMRDRETTSRRDLEWLERRVIELRALNQSLFREIEARRDKR